MKNIKVTTPENIELDVELAEVMSRAIAASIDGLIQWIAICIVSCAFLQIVSLRRESDDLLSGFVIGGLLIITTLIIYGYYMFFEIKWNGQTLGKKLMHLRVIRNNGGPVTVKQVVIRNLFRVIIDNTGLGVVFIFLNKQNKRIGDMVAGTMVVVEEKQERPISLEDLIMINEEIKSALTQEEYNVLREYLSRRQIMTNEWLLREEIKEYFKDKFIRLGIYENNQSFINSL